MKKQVVIADTFLSGLNQKIEGESVHSFGKGWKISSFGGVLMLSSDRLELSDKLSEHEGALKVRAIKPATAGAPFLHWDVPKSKMKIKGEWVLSFYARTQKGPLEILSSIFHSKDGSTTETKHHMASHRITENWIKFTSIVQLDEDSTASSFLSIFFFLPKESLFELEVARVEIKKEPKANLLTVFLKSKGLRQRFLFATTGIALGSWNVSAWFLKILYYPIKVILELTYRLLLWFSIRYKLPQYLSICDKSFWTFDKDFGFNYTPGDKITGVNFDRSGNLVNQAYYYYVNALGNVGFDDGRAFQQAKLRILTFGDSFTVGTGETENGPTWPDLLKANLSKSLHSEISVLNYARDGTGLLNMFDIAAAKVSEWKPDLFIIAFISGDLSRGRFWRTVTTVDGFERILVTAEPNPNPNPKHCADAAMFNSRLTPEWIQQRTGKKLKPDPVVRHIFKQYRYIQRESHRHVNLWDVSRSFLKQKMLHNDPFYGLTPQYTNCPPFQKQSYAEDEKTFRNIQILKETGIPMLLVHLPTFDVFNDPTDSYENDPLFISLSHLCGVPIIKLKNFYSEKYGLVFDLFRLKYGDGHYSDAGLKFVADELNKLLLQILPSSKSFMKRFGHNTLL